MANCLSEEKPQFGLRALMIVVAGAAVAFGLIRLAPPLAIVAVSIFAVAMGILIEIGMRLSLGRLERASKESTWRNIEMRFFLIVCIALGFSVFVFIAVMLINLFVSD